MDERALNADDIRMERRLAEMQSDFQAELRRIWRSEEWEQLSPDERRNLATWIVELIESDVRQAMEAPSFGVRGEEHLSRTVSLVDERGWRELNRIQDDALWAILAVKSESADRLAESGEDAIPVLSAMLCVEMLAPPRPVE
ncbi:MAG TPA: hypothetical protein VN752_05425 [Solirubrobacterales bacterium]|nr:hypothetical protein [Solirubrobacterales bacterium]